MTQDVVHNPLAATWETYARLCLPADTPPDMAIEVRATYYSGASAMLTILEYIAGLSGTDQAAVMHRLQGEVTIFLATRGTSLEGKV